MTDRVRPGTFTRREFVRRTAECGLAASAAGSLAAYRLPGTDEVRAQLRDEEWAREATRYGAG
jgi:hypothetical protein